MNNDIRRYFIIRITGDNVIGYYYEFKLFAATARSNRRYRTARKAIRMAIAEAEKLLIWYERIRVIGDLDKPTKQWISNVSNGSES